MPKTQSRNPGEKAAFLSLFLFISGTYAFLLTQGSFNFFSNELFGDAFDSLAQSFWHGAATVDPDRIGFEKWIVEGRIYMYFGPFPALLRMVLDFAFPSKIYQWSRVSCFAASQIALLFFLMLCRRALERNKFLPERSKKIFLFISFAAFGLGSPQILLVSIGHIFHESILWAFAASLGALVFTFEFLNRRSSLNLFLLGVFASVAFLSRVTFGIPFVGIFFWCYVLFLRDRKFLQGTNRQDLAPAIFRAIVMLLPVLAACLFYGWYNAERFGDFWKFVDFRYYPAYPSGIGEAVDYRRIPSSLLNYFAVVPENFSPFAPFIHQAPIHHLNSLLHSGYRREWVISLTLSAPWLLIGAMFGCYFLYTKKNYLSEKALPIFFLPQWWCVLGYYFISSRYSVDLMPLLVFAYAQFLQNFRVNKIMSEKVLAFTGCGLLVVSVATSLASTLSFSAFHNWPVSAQWRSFLLDHFSEIDLFLGVASKPALVGSLAVILLSGMLFVAGIFVQQGKRSRKEKAFLIVPLGLVLGLSLFWLDQWKQAHATYLLWKAAYYPSEDFSGTPLVVRERRVGKRWLDTSPLNGIKNNHFSIRYESCFHVESEETLTWIAEFDDGVRLYVDDVQVMNYWAVQPAMRQTAEVRMQPGWHPVVVEYFEAEGEALLSLKIKDGSREVEVPVNRLKYPEGQPGTCR